ncbi:MAG: hypothetical protein Q9217_000325, partial [Psora testacea]
MTNVFHGNGESPRHHQRTPTLPFAPPVFVHAIFSALIVYIDQNLNRNLGLPASIVFRNQTSYNRFWDGRNYLSVIITSVRNLSRSFLACSSIHTYIGADKPALQAARADTEHTVRILVAILYATKNHLRAEWGAEIIPGTALSPNTGNPTTVPEYGDLLPQGLKGLDDRGVGLPLQLTFFVEQYIKRSFDSGAFHGPQASQMQVQLNTLTEAYGRMETIRLTSIPVALLIHQKQVLSLFGCMLPFALVDEMGWWTVFIVAMVMFTLYGIDGIGSQLEDPFGYDRNDIRMDAIVEDIREEVFVLLEEWKRVGEGGGEMFLGKGGSGGRRTGVGF